MRAKSYVKQKTFTLVLQDESSLKITIKMRRKTHLANRNGWSAIITDSDGGELRIPMINVLRMNEAEDIAYFKYVKRLTAQPKTVWFSDRD